MPPPWFKEPQFIVGTALAFVLYFASLFNEEVRRGLRWPGQKMTRKMLESYLKFTENELASLEYIHDNAYHLVLWLAWTALSFLKWLFWSVILGIIVSIAAYLITKDVWFRSPSMILGPAMGVIVGHVQRSYGTVMALYKYEQRTSEMKEGIAQAKAELAKRAPKK